MRNTLSQKQLLCSALLAVLPGADSHLVRVMYVGTVAAAITLAKAVVVHAVLLLLLLLTSMSDDCKTPLDCTAFSRIVDKPQVSTNQ